MGLDEYEAAPTWYPRVLLDGLRAEVDGRPAGEVVGEDDWDAPLPEWAKAWRDAPEAAPNPAGRD